MLRYIAVLNSRFRFCRHLQVSACSLGLPRRFPKKGARHDLRPSAGPPDSCAVSGTLRDRVETSAYETIRLVRGLADKVSQGHEEPVAGAEAEAECLLWDRVQ